MSYAAFRLSQNGAVKPWGGSIGNANEWDEKARAAGISVDTTPVVGSIAQWDSGATGHVAYVEVVTATYIDISEDSYISDTSGYSSTRRLDRGGATFAAAEFLHIRDLGSSGNPVLSFEATRRVPGGVRVQGWSTDSDSPGSVPIHAYGVNGEPVLNGQPNGTFGAGYADLYRGDVGSHAFDIFVPAGPGMHTVCVYALNITGTPGGTTKLCHNSVVVSADPVGNAELIGLLPGRYVRIAGWALDRDLASPIVLHVYYGGNFGAEVVASLPRPDVGLAFPYYGDSHGFDGSFPMPPGSYNVCVYAINGGGTLGSSQLLRCQSLTMT